jgi:hypothetical protein
MMLAVTFGHENVKDVLPFRSLLRGIVESRQRGDDFGAASRIVVRDGTRFAAPIWELLFHRVDGNVCDVGTGFL